MSQVTAGRALHLWSLHEDVVVEPGPNADELVLHSRRFGPERIDRPDPLVREALRRMELGPVLLTNVTARSPDGARYEGHGTRLVLPTVLNRLSHLIVRTLSWDDLRGPLLSVASVRRVGAFVPVAVSARRLIRLMSGVRLTLAEAGFTLDLVGAAYQVHLHRPEAVWVVGLLAWPVTPSDMTSALPLPPDVTRAVLSYLVAAGMTEDCGPRRAAHG
ncbi:NADH oxidase [Streptomyces sp. NPDC001118]|uniref:NADH oxidase n=1 Tax=Streptomyces sp. NPDC002589 TaxID=3154420 RepID=UPI003325BA0C